jgi:hypothetical protein
MSADACRVAEKRFSGETMNSFPFDDGYSFSDEECAQAFSRWEIENPDRATFLDYLWRSMERYEYVRNSQEHEFIDMDAIVQAFDCNASWDAVFALFSVPDEYQTDEQVKANLPKCVWCNDFIYDMLDSAVNGDVPKHLAFGRLILVMRDCFNEAEIFEWARECQRKNGGAAFTAGIGLQCNPNSRNENRPLWEAWNDGWTHASRIEKGDNPA